MPGIDLLIPFLIATLLFAYFPGPALLYTAAQTLARGRRAGLFAALGIHLGCYVHVIAAALGLSAIFLHAPMAFFVLKVAGAGYLIWLGVQMLRRRQGGEMTELPALAVRKSARRAFLESVMVEVLNPKVAIFFIAFLPQFVDPGATWPLWVQFLVMGTFVNLMFSSADIITVYLTDRVVRAVRSSSTTERVARYLGGSVLIGLGAHLALSRAQ